jgi:phosphomannomutase
MSTDQFASTIESAKHWIKNDSNEATSTCVSILIDKTEGGDEVSRNELVSLFPPDGRRIAFGTAGLRSRMMAGPLGMNDLVIVQTAQGLARYCLKQRNNNNNAGETLRAVVGYDHRANPALNLSSLSFAILTSLVFEDAGIDCLLLDGFIFTPMVPYVLQEIGAAVGVMITASHNPKDDAGYKVYASDGCQIRSPMDTEIATEILGNLEPWRDYAKLIETRQQAHADPCLGLSQPEQTQKMLSAYFETLKNSGLLTGQAKMPQLPNSLTPPSIVYTAMHGVGYNFAIKAFEAFGFPPFQTVVEQRDPDPEFRTVPFPNPEEKGALDLAKKFAQENGCDIVLANDPDADRLAVAELDRSSNAWTVFTGDQIGVLLGLWIWEQVGKNCGKVSCKRIALSAFSGVGGTLQCSKCINPKTCL